MALDVTRIDCGRCGAPVSRVMVTPITADGSFEIVASCHGETDIMRLTRADLIDLGPDPKIVSAVAFKRAAIHGQA